MQMSRLCFESCGHVAASSVQGPPTQIRTAHSQKGASIYTRRPPLPTVPTVLDNPSIGTGIDCGSLALM
jgi:hypothetical protein